MLERLFYREYIVCFLFLLSISVVCSCGDTPTDPGPETPSFSITTITFTGDSTGSSNRRFGIRASSRRAAYTDSKNEPYTEVTIEWLSLDIDSVLSYSVCRSEDPGIPSGSTAYTTAGITTDTSFIDEDSLAWGDTYYYAVKATGSDSSEYWSNEVSIVMPNSQFPTPSELTAEDLPVGHCQLSWTACPDSDFQSYTLIRNDLPSSLNADTLCVVYDADATEFLDSLPPHYAQRYYQVLTKDDQGLMVGSNFLEYTNNYGTPWRVYDVWKLPNENILTKSILSSSDGSRIYFSYRNEYYPYYYQLCMIETESGYSNSYSTLNNEISDYGSVSQSNDVLLSVNMDTYFSILLLDGSSLSKLDSLQVSFACDGMVSSPSGEKVLVHPNGSNQSIVLDISSFSLTDTVDCSFTEGQYLEDYGIYVWGNGPMQRLDPETFEVEATGTIYPSGALISNSNGEICCTSSNDQVFNKLDPFNLTLLHSEQFPCNTSTAALLEASGEVYAYLYCNWAEPPDVYDTDAMEYVGTVSMNQSDINFEEMLALPQRQEVWSEYFDMSQGRYGVLKIVQ